MDKVLCHLFPIILDKCNPPAEILLVGIMVHLLDNPFSFFISRVSFAREDNLHRSPPTVHDLLQSFKILENEVGTLIT